MSTLTALQDEISILRETIAELHQIIDDLSATKISEPKSMTGGIDTIDDYMEVILRPSKSGDDDVAGADGQAHIPSLPVFRRIAEGWRRRPDIDTDDNQPVEGGL